MPHIKKMQNMKVKVEQPGYDSGDPKKPFACTKCHMKFKYSSNLVKHEAVHSGEQNASDIIKYTVIET